MAYIKRNIDRQFDYYNQIEKVGGVECVTDVYARSLQQPNHYWFAAKVARCTGMRVFSLMKRKRRMQKANLVVKRVLLCDLHFLLDATLSHSLHNHA